MKYHTLFFSKIGKDVAKFVFCCSCDWRFKGLTKVNKHVYIVRDIKLTSGFGSLAFTVNISVPTARSSGLVTVMLDGEKIGLPTSVILMVTLVSSPNAGSP